MPAPSACQCAAAALAVREFRYATCLLSCAACRIPMARESPATSGKKTKASSSAEASKFPRVVRGFREIADDYDGFIFDQYGVLHNGVSALLGAPECVERLYGLGKKMVILSNASFRATTTEHRLPKFSLKSEFFAGGVVTSGEQARLHIENMAGDKKCLWLTWRYGADKQEYLEGIPGLQLVSSCAEADFVLLQGCEVLFGGTASERQVSFRQDGNFGCIEDLLRECAARRLPMLCANPDYVIITPEGRKEFMPGNWARRYSQLLEEISPGLSKELVTLFGKPGAKAFGEAVQRLRDLGCSRICHVGDSLEHDVAGALAAGIDVVFIADGIHRGELGLAGAPADDVGSVPKEDDDEDSGAKRRRVDGYKHVLQAEDIMALCKELKVPPPTHAATACVF